MKQHLSPDTFLAVSLRSPKPRFSSIHDSQAHHEDLKSSHSSTGCIVFPFLYLFLTSNHDKKQGQSMVSASREACRTVCCPPLSSSAHCPTLLTWLSKKKWFDGYSWYAQEVWCRLGKLGMHWGRTARYPRVSLEL